MSPPDSSAGDAAPPRSTFRVGGMLIGYYVLCPRKAWLSMNGLWMEQESTTVALGRQIDDDSYERERKEIMLTAEAPDGTPLVGKVDWAQLDAGVLHETKKSAAAEEAHVWQLRFYLWLLSLNGVTGPQEQPFRGEINYPRQRRTQAVELHDAHTDRLADIVAALCRLSEQGTPPPRHDTRSFCRQCAFEDLCYG
jgi:CRISPR-associated exonuclease Cas4